MAASGWVTAKTTSAPVWVSSPVVRRGQGHHRSVGHHPPGGLTLVACGRVDIDPVAHPEQRDRVGVLDAHRRGDDVSRIPEDERPAHQSPVGQRLARSHRTGEAVALDSGDTRVRASGYEVGVDPDDVHVAWAEHRTGGQVTCRDDKWRGRWRTRRRRRVRRRRQPRRRTRRPPACGVEGRHGAAAKGCRGGRPYADPREQAAPAGRRPQVSSRRPRLWTNPCCRNPKTVADPPPVSPCSCRYPCHCWSQRRPCQTRTTRLRLPALRPPSSSCRPFRPWLPPPAAAPSPHLITDRHRSRWSGSRCGRSRSP